MKDLLKSIGKFLWSCITSVGYSVIWVLWMAYFIVMTTIITLIICPIQALVQVFKDDVPPAEAFDNAIDSFVDYLKSIVVSMDD